MTTNRPLRVFLCHSSNDKPAVRELYQKLRAEPWIQPWLDEEELYPGQDWNVEIEKAVEAADAIIVCLSKNSINKEGYVQKEIKAALDYSDYKPEGTVFIIPIRLEECKPPSRLSKWQYADYFKGQRDRAFQRLLVSLKKRATSLYLKVEPPLPELKLIPRHGKEIPDWFIDTANEVLQVEVPLSNKLTLSNGMEFMYVPAGKFLMGSDTGNDDEKPLHNVDIPYDYWIARLPVTNELYYAYTTASGYKHPIYSWERKKDHPVVLLNLNSVISYCQWLNSVHKAELPSGLVLRIPTESEWEKSARGIDGREYPWGNIFDRERCNSEKSEDGRTTPVGLYSPQGDSPYGCADMVGKIWEWTHSLYKPYPYIVGDDSENVDTFFSNYVVRGDPFYVDEKKYARCAARNCEESTWWSLDLGFRVCLAPHLQK